MAVSESASFHIAGLGAADSGAFSAALAQAASGSKDAKAIRLHRLKNRFPTATLLTLNRSG
jgi:hypothetical protein